jgi:outer membrane protein TolC
MFPFRPSRVRLALPAVLAAAALLLRPEQPHAQPLTLSEALQLAETDQPILRAQEAGVRAAEDAKVAAGQLPDPKLQLGVINMPVTGPDAFSLTSDFMTMRMIGVAQEFPRAAKRKLKSELAAIEGQQRGLELAFTRRAIRRDVAMAWLDAFYAQRAVRIASDLERESARQIEASSVGIRAGKASAADVAAARVDLELVKDRTDQLRQVEEIARAELSRWIGAQASRPLPEEAPELPRPGPTEEVLAHLKHHPHLAAQDRQIDLAETESKLAQLATKPDWNVEFSYNVRGSAFSDMVSVQFGIDLPIFQRNRQVRDVASKLALAERARAQRDDNLRDMEAMLRRHDAQWRLARDRAERYREIILPQARQRVDATLAAYRSGRGQLSTVLEARRAALDLRLRELMLEAEAARAQVQIVFYDQK